MEWHTGYEQAREKAHKAFLRQLKRTPKPPSRTLSSNGMGKVMPEPEYDLPLNAEGDAAIYVVSRISGEGNDRTPLKGDIRLTDSEVRDILALDKKFTRFMLVLNVGGVVDLSPVMACATFCCCPSSVSRPAVRWRIFCWARPIPPAS